VVVEAESSKVGDCRLPPELWKAMTAAPRIALRASVEARAAYLTRAYSDMVEDPARLMDVLAQLRLLHGAEVIGTWQEMARAGAYADLAAGLMQRHYDPRYEKHRARMGQPAVEIEAAGLGPADLPALAGQIAEQVARLISR
jgi:tRNA 2-selenouridine synthase